MRLCRLGLIAILLILEDVRLNMVLIFQEIFTVTFLYPFFLWARLQLCTQLLCITVHIFLSFGWYLNTLGAR